MKRKLTPGKGGRLTPAKGGREAPSGRMLAATDVDDMLCCPITHEVMQDPVICADGAWSILLHAAPQHQEHSERCIVSSNSGLAQTLHASQK